MKKVGLAVLLLGAALCIPGCGFEEGAGASVTVIQATPTPIPTPNYPFFWMLEYNRLWLALCFRAVRLSFHNNVVQS